ncbi:MAG: acyl-CoA dehydrogenase family protein [Lewinellaceae bacterium]|nr:acyl-CoA dehydrogenase family protein [Phaeodactylibacter sp.]MCB9038145.1 acyl-CoA dehydrogenase family protein [Lewinellaceae bacterium]
MTQSTFEKVKMSGEGKRPVAPSPVLKGGYFIAGDTPPQSLFISEELSEEHRMMGEMTTGFCIREIQEPFFRRGRELAVTNKTDKEEVLGLLKKAGALGLCGVSIPEQYGGIALDFKGNTLFSMVMANGFSFATTVGAQTSIGSLPIVYYGNEAQKKKYLPGIASAELIAAYALTEPGAGSDANSGKTSATLSPDGQHYILNGQKIWITNGGFADIFIVFAKIGEDEKLSAFIVERNFEGFSVGPEEKKMGIKGSSTVQIYFDNCKVPAENLLGKRQEGFRMALNILNGGRLKAGAGGISGAQLSLTKAVQYAAERQQFGQPISNFGAIQYKIGDIAMQAFANEAALFRTADNIDRKEAELIAAGLPENEAKVKAIREFAVEAAIIKVKGSELGCYATDEAIQIYGGMGYAQETGMEMGYRDVRITKIYEGTNEVNRLLSVGELAKRAMVSKEIDLAGAGKKIPAFLLRQLLPFRSKEGYAEEKRIVQGLKNAFLFLYGMAGKKLGKKMIDEQEIVMNLSTLLAEAYVCESVLLKVEKLEGMAHADKAKLEIQRQMMQLYLYEALARARKAALEATASFSTGSQKRTYTMVANALLKPYDVNPKEMRRAIAGFVIEKRGYCF